MCWKKAVILCGIISLAICLSSCGKYYTEEDIEKAEEHGYSHAAEDARWLVEDEYNIDLDEAEEAYNTVKDIESSGYTADDLVYDYEETAAELDWYEHNIVFVSTTGEKFHRRHCSHIDNTEIFAMFYQTAEHDGYEPCLDCIPPQTHSGN